MTRELKYVGKPVERANAAVDAAALRLAWKQLIRRTDTDGRFPDAGDEQGRGQP